jgi:hypothetical protein
VPDGRRAHAMRPGAAHRRCTALTRPSTRSRRGGGRAAPRSQHARSVSRSRARLAPGLTRLCAAQHHGSTDLLVTLAVMQHRGAAQAPPRARRTARCGARVTSRTPFALPLAGLAVEKAVPHLPRVAAAMVAFCEAEAAGVRRRRSRAACTHAALTPSPAPRAQISEGLQVLPGVEALLAALAARANCVTALVRARDACTRCARSVVVPSARPRPQRALTPRRAGDGQPGAHRLGQDGGAGACC